MPDLLDGLQEGVSLQDVVAATYNGMSAEFQARFPEGLLDNISQFGEELSNYTADMNDFIYSLINQIGRININYRMFNNPLAMFKKGKLEYGDTIEDAYVDIIKGFLYADEVPNDNPGDQWETFKPEVDVVFHKINKRLVYPLTINESQIRRAFRSYKELEKFLSGCMQQMYNADNLDDFGLMVNLLGMYANVDGEDKYYKVHVDAITDEASAKGLITKIRAMVETLRFPSRKFNSMGVMNFANAEDLYLLVTPALSSYVDVNVLASAFNMDKTSFVGNVVKIPELPITNAVAMLVDKEFLQIWGTYFEIASTGRNARHLTTNYFLHDQGIMSLSPFYTAIEFTTAEVSDVTAVEILGDDTIMREETKHYTVDVTGGATTGVRWELVGNPQYASINQAGNLSIGKLFKGNAVTIRATSVLDEEVYDEVLIVVRKATDPYKIVVSGDDTITKSSSTVTKTYTATVSGGGESEAVKWYLDGTLEGVSINESTGVVSVTKDASTGSITVVAQSKTIDSLEGSKTITIA